MGGEEVGFSAWVPIPKGRPGGIVPPPSVLAPESALGSVPTVALSSGQVRGGIASRHCPGQVFPVGARLGRRALLRHLALRMPENGASGSVTFRDEATRRGQIIVA
jgi:hypothetical protein